MYRSVFVFILAAACGTYERHGDPGPRPRPEDAGSIFVVGGDDSGTRPVPPPPSDPCAQCDADATCTNDRCTCNAGFDGDGITCMNVDECAIGAASCDAHARCIDTIGGYDCACNAGYSGNGRSCTAINCAPCTADFQCGSGQCMQRYCDGRFACYTDTACPLVGGDACTPSGAWQICTTAGDCPERLYPDGSSERVFWCDAWAPGGGSAPSRCWPALHSWTPQIEVPPQSEPVDCPPAPPGSVNIEVRPVAPPCGTPCEEPYNPFSRCELHCSAGSTCPYNMRCVSGQCQ